MSNVFFRFHEGVYGTLEAACKLPLVRGIRRW
jgi:hypothetical protein